MKIKKYSKIIFIFVIILLGIVILNRPNKTIIENEIEETYENTLIEEETEVVNSETSVTDNNKEDVVQNISRIGKYNVIGRIKIDKINLYDVILEESPEDLLDFGIEKIWGPNINEPGNVSISGHNFAIQRSELFTRLKEIKVNDTFELIDLKNRSIKYEVYKIYIVKPEDTSCLDQNYDGKREVTLITCTPRSKRKTYSKSKRMLITS